MLINCRTRSSSSAIHWCAHSEKHEIQALQSAGLTAKPRSLLRKKPLRAWKLVHCKCVTPLFGSIQTWFEARQAAFPPPQQHTPKRLGKLDDTHPNQRNLHPPFNLGHSAEKRQTMQGKKPTESSRKHYLRCSEVCCKARKRPGIRLWHSPSGQGPCSAPADCTSAPLCLGTSPRWGVIAVLGNKQWLTP